MGPLAFALAGILLSVGSRAPEAIPVEGVVLGPGGPIAGVPVGVHLFERGHRETASGPDGRFRIDLPPGEAIFLVGPAARRGLAQAPNRELRVAPGLGPLTFRLVTGRRVSGILLGLDGAPRGAPGNVSRLEDGAAFGLGAEPDGRFATLLPPGRYEITFFVGEEREASRAFEIAARDVEGLTVRVRRLPPLAPDPPLDLERISLSEPGADGRALLRGASGAAPPDHHVVVHLLSVDRIRSVRADGEGAFALRLFAPHGSWLQIHARPRSPFVAGREIRPDPRAGPAWVLRHEPGARMPRDLHGVVPTPMGGAFFAGTIDRLAFDPGDGIAIRGTLRMPDPDGAADRRRLAARLRIGLTRLFDARGLERTPVRILASVYLTPTGLPIEGDEPSTCVDADLSLRAGETLRFRDGAFEAGVRIRLRIPRDLEAGWYGVGWSLEFAEGVERPEAVTFLQEIQAFSLDTLAVVRIGRPARPALAPLLLPGRVSLGAHGLHPEEAWGRWQVSPAAVFAPRMFVVPWRDLEGRAIRYRLDPALPLVSRANRPFPLSIPAPNVPLRFPSGELRARVRGPGGFDRILGPRPILAGRVGLYGCRPYEVNPVRKVRRFERSFGNNYLAEMLEVATEGDGLAIAFPRPGDYAIDLEGWIADIHGHRYDLRGRFRLVAARPLDLEPMVYPGVPFEVGDAWLPGLQVLPGLAAEVEVVMEHVPHGDPAQAVRRTWRGRANRFGYFDPGEAFVFADPGEYRAEIRVRAEGAAGALRAGAVATASLVAPKDSPIACHGERGVRCPRSTNRPAWYVEGLSPDIVREPGEGFHAPFPYFPGDVLWLEDGESIFPTITFIDRDGRFQAAIERHRGELREGIYSGLFNRDLLPIDRIAIGEIPAVGWGPRPAGQFPASRTFHAYAYTTTIRPGLQVRSIVQELTPVAYWDLNDPYNLQDGAGPEGDLPGDVKAFFGGIVLRGEGLEGYGIYGSMAVIVPRDDPLGNRVTPPFRGRGGGVDGGPLLVLRGRSFDLFVTLTAVRPGTVLEVGDRFRLAGLFWPPLPSRLEAVVRGPAPATRSRGEAAGGSPARAMHRLHARGSRVGFFATDAFVVRRPGRYEVTLRGIHDGRISSGRLRKPYPEGDVPGTRDGRFSVYVVPRDASALAIEAIEDAPGRVRIEGSVPAGWEAPRVRLTATFPGVVLEDRRLRIREGRFAWTYDLAALRGTFPNLDPDPVDTIDITVFAEGTTARGPAFRAAKVLLQGRRIHVTARDGPRSSRSAR